MSASGYEATIAAHWREVCYWDKSQHGENRVEACRAPLDAASYLALRQSFTRLFEVRRVGTFCWIASQKGDPSFPSGTSPDHPVDYAQTGIAVVHATKASGGMTNATAGRGFRAVRMPWFNSAGLAGEAGFPEQQVAIAVLLTQLHPSCCIRQGVKGRVLTDACVPLPLLDVSREIDFPTSRAQARNRSTIGLSVRWRSVTTTIGHD